MIINSCVYGSSLQCKAHQVLHTPAGLLTDELSLLATHAHNYNGGTHRKTQNTGSVHAFLFFPTTFMSFLILSQTIIGTRWPCMAVPAGAQTHGGALSVLHYLVTEAQLIQEPIQYGCIQMDNRVRILIEKKLQNITNLIIIWLFT